MKRTMFMLFEFRMPARRAATLWMLALWLALPAGLSWGENYGRRIVLPEKAGTGLKASADDLAACLKQMTGLAFEVATEAPAGAESIQLVYSTSPSVPPDLAARFTTQGREPFWIRTDGDRRMWIVANADDGLSHGIYYYLDQLGWRWYFPTDTWTIAPPKRAAGIAVNLHLFVAPAFKMRNFFGTGGFGGKLPIDPKMQFQEKWDTWKRRNRFGGEFRIAGHSGEAFNLAHKDVLLQHPEYFATVNGQRTPYGPTAKLDPTNDEAVKLYVEDRVKTLRKAVQTDPNSASSFAVSVEPSDGGGHCNSPECLEKIGGPSEQVFYIANAVAKAVAAEMPGRNVSLYAYNEHAAVPKIPLEPNVYVSLIPYGFQRTGLTPEEFIEAWSKKVKRMSIYDYWSIPDWTSNLPSYSYLTTIPDRIRLWHSKGVEGVSNESTYSSGALGIGCYLAGRLFWDPKVDDKAVLAEFYTRSFGPAAPSMKRMLERWSTDFLLSKHELGLSYRDLVEAYQLADGDPAITARLDDYGRYLHYIRLWYEYQSARGAEPRREATLALLRHIWNVYDTTMVQSFRMAQLITNRYAKDPELVAMYDGKNPQAAGWQQVKPLTHDDVANLVVDGAARYKPLDFEQRSFSNRYVVLPGSTAPKADPAKIPTMAFSNSVYFTVVTPPDMKQLHLQITAPKPIRLFLRDDKGQKITEVPVGPAPAGQQFNDVALNIPKPGLYRIQVQSPKMNFSMQPPAGLPLVMHSFLNSQGAPLPRMYFYVPKNLKTVAMYLEYHLLPKIYDPDGKLVQPTADAEDSVAGKMVTFTVPPGQDGKIWSFGEVRAPRAMQMLNVPHAFAFYPDALLVPDDALK